MTRLPRLIQHGSDRIDRGTSTRCDWGHFAPDQGVVSLTYAGGCLRICLIGRSGPLPSVPVSTSPEPEPGEQHLLRARDDFVAKRDIARADAQRYESAIKNIDATLMALRSKVLGPTDSSGGKPTATASGANPRSARQAVLAVVSSADRTFRTSEIVEKAQKFGTDANADTIRSLVSKMGKSGELRQVSRGVYSRPGLRLEADPEAPPAEGVTGPDIAHALIDDNGQVRHLAVETKAADTTKTKVTGALDSMIHTSKAPTTGRFTMPDTYKAAGVRQFAPSGKELPSADDNGST